MNSESEVFGCYVSITQATPSSNTVMKNRKKEQGILFRNYVWGNNGIDEKLKKLKHKDYGNDLVLALFQFYVNPMPIQIQNIKSIEPYRKNEKSIGIPIIITEENFFNKNEKERNLYLKQTILEKLKLLSIVIKQKKLDTNIELLIADTEKVLN